MFIQKYKTPSTFSDILMSSDGESLTGLWFENSYDEIKHSTNTELKDLEIFAETKRWLDIYFSGKIPDFVPKYKINNTTPFRQMVTDILNDIPYGRVVTYKDIADEIAKKKNITKMSSQAVGGAVGHNPICIIIPCHRVVGQNNNLVGYGGGIKNKIRLLELEQNDINKFIIPKKGNKL